MRLGTALVALTLALSACGGSDVDVDEVPLSNTQAKPPAQAAKCLEGEGFENVQATADRVTFARGAGEGSIQYFPDERAAIQDRVDRDQEPNSTAGGVGQANYTFAGEGFDEVGGSISGCLF